MGSVKGFVDRISNQEHILFRKKGIFLFNFPMFFIPLECYQVFIEELSNLIGFEKVEKIVSSIGYIQGNFAMEYFEKSFNIKPHITDFSFTAEQYQLLGLGIGEIYSIKNKDIIVKYKSFLPYNIPFYDFYFKGMIEGTFSYYFKKQMKVIRYENKKDADFFHMTYVNTHNSLFLDTYKLKNISIKEIPLEKNNFYNKCKDISNFHIISKNGTFFGGKHYTLNLMSIFISLYYFTIKENINSKFIFEKLGKSCGDYLIPFFLNEDKISLFNLLTLCGFGSIIIVKQTKKSVTLQINKDIFENIFENLFPKEYHIENNDFKIGFLKSIFSYIMKTENITIKKESQRHILFLTFETP